MQQRKKNYLGHKPLYDRERLLEAQSLASQHGGLKDNKFNIDYLEFIVGNIILL